MLEEEEDRRPHQEEEQGSLITGPSKLPEIPTYLCSWRVMQGKRKGKLCGRTAKYKGELVGELIPGGVPAGWFCKRHINMLMKEQELTPHVLEETSTPSNMSVDFSFPKHQKNIPYKGGVQEKRRERLKKLNQEKNDKKESAMEVEDDEILQTGKVTFQNHGKNENPILSTDEEGDTVEPAYNNSSTVEAPPSRPKSSAIDIPMSQKGKEKIPQESDSESDSETDSSTATSSDGEPEEDMNDPMVLLQAKRKRYSQIAERVNQEYGRFSYF